MTAAEIAAKNEQARWSEPEPHDPFWVESGLADVLRQDMTVQILAPLRCPQCDRGWYWILPVPGVIPPDELAPLLEERRVDLRDGIPGRTVAREYRCDECWEALRVASRTAGFEPAWPCPSLRGSRDDL